MSFFDCELPASEAQSVASHLAHCAECTALAAQFRDTSEQLAHWTVPTIPATLEDSITAIAAGTNSRRKIDDPAHTPSLAGWNWKPWAIGGGGSLAAALILIFVVLWNLNPRDTPYHQTADSKKLTYLSAPREDSTRSQRTLYERRRDPEAPTNMGSYDQTSSHAGGAGIIGGEEKKRGAIAAGDPTDMQLSETHAPMIARMVSLTIHVKDLAASRSSLESILARHRGYAAQMTVATPQDAFRYLQASLRIPASELTSAIADLKALGHVEDEGQSGEEVTQEHDDLLARLKTARETEARFQSILQQRTGSVADVLEVEESIARVRGEIESMETDQDALEHRVAFATVQLNLSEESKTPPGDSVSARMSKALAAGYRNATGTLLGIVIFTEEYGPTILIWLAILAVPVILLRRRYVRNLSRL
jgi:hypothetical protein